MRKIFLGAFIIGATAFGALPASAADDCAGSGSLGTDDCGGVVVEGGELEPTPEAVSPAAPITDAVEVAAPTQPSQATLPVTGTETATIALAGVALIGGGAIMVTRSRSHKTA